MDPKELRTPFFTVLFILVGIFLYTRLAGPIPFSISSVQTSKSNLFSVTGTGKATAVPDTALISFGITKTSPNVLDAQSQVNNIINKITTDLKNLGIEDKNIKTTNYSVYPNYDYYSGRQNANGYTVSQNIEVRIKPIDKANKALDIVTTDGGNIVGGISFVLDDATQKQLQNKARADAIKEAKEKAQNLSGLSGLRLGRIVDVQEGASFQPRPIMATEKAVGAPSQDSTNLNPGENIVTSTITLSYETY